MTLAKFEPNRTTGSKVMTKKFTSAGTVEPEPDPGNRDFRTVEPGNKKSGYLTSLGLSHTLGVFLISTSGSDRGKS